MGWVTEDGEHEGWAGTVVPDGRVASAYSGGAVLVGDPGNYERVPAEEVVGWVGKCECGWTGSRWIRVADPDLADWDERKVYYDEGNGWAPESVEDAIQAEWEIHVAPHEAMGAVRRAAEDANGARRRLDAAVRAARGAGASWADIGRATGITRQSAHERWGGDAVSAS